MFEFGGGTGEIDFRETCLVTICLAHLFVHLLLEDGCRSHWIFQGTIMYAGGYDSTLDGGHGTQRKSNDVVISNDTRKQQLTVTNSSLLFVIGYITKRNHGLHLLIRVVVMVSEIVMLEDWRNWSAMVSRSKTVTLGEN
jgi:hypothetical protein